MTRSLVLLPMVFSAACSVGSYGEIPNMTTDGMMSVDDRDLCANVVTPGTAYIHTSAPATTRAGMGCVAAACHLATSLGAGAPAFTFAGTVYKDTNGTTPRGGVTIRLFPTTGNTKKSVATAVTDDAGNFYISAPLTAFPYNTDVAGCGIDTVAKGIRPMVGTINKAESNCNAGNTCHQAAPTKTATPVYLLD